MSKAPEPKNAISTCVFGLQDCLKHLQKQWPILSPSESHASEPSIHGHGNELHVFGPVNIDKARQEFSHHIDAIRAICSQFENEVLGDVLKMGQGADPAFRKHFTHLKEQALLESSVLRVKNTLKHTRDYLDLSLDDMSEAKAKIETQKLERLAQSMGLMTFVDSSQRTASGVPMTTITLGGTVIVVDIDIDATGRVMRTKVTYVSEALQNDQDERVDRMLAHNLQSRNLDLFKRNLGTLALYDRLNVKYTSTDFFMIIKGLLADLKSICSQEALLLSDDLAAVLMEGHGIPSLHLDYPGISISYWLEKKYVLGNDWTSVQESIEKDQNHPALSMTSKLLVSFESSLHPQQFLPPTRMNYLLGFDETEESIRESNNGIHYKIVKETLSPKFIQPMRFVKPLPTHPGSPAIFLRFVVTLDPPIPTSDLILQKLMKMTGLTKQDTASQQIPTKSISGILSLEDLLAHDAHKSTGTAAAAQEKAPMSSKLWKLKAEEHEEHDYKWIASRETSGKLLKRIAFNHPVQLFNIIQCLRQQHMYNNLFQSIFHQTIYPCTTTPLQTSKALSLDEILKEENYINTAFQIEVAAIDAPNTLHLTLSLPPTQTVSLLTLIPLAIDISPETPARPTVHLDQPCALYDTHHQLMIWNPYVFDEEKMTKVLQTGYSIPLLMSWLWKRIKQCDDQIMVKAENAGLKRERYEDINMWQEEKFMKMDVSD